MVKKPEWRSASTFVSTGADTGTDGTGPKGHSVKLGREKQFCLPKNWIGKTVTELSPVH